MGGVVDVEAADEDLLPVEVGEQGLHGVDGTGDDGGAATVDGGDTDLAAVVGEAGLDLRVRQRDDGHRAAAGQFGQGLAAQGDHGRGVVEAERPGDAGRRDLALAVPDDRVRPYATGAPHGGEGHHHGEQHRLDDVYTVQGRGAGVAAQDGGHRPVGEWAQGGVAAVQLVGEHRVPVEEITCHAGPLGALPGEHERQLACGQGLLRPDHLLGVGPVGGEGS